jgi:hypothetical protein
MLYLFICSIIFLEDKHKMLLYLSIFFEYQQFFQHRICFSIQPQLQLVNLQRNRRYFVIKLHTWFCLSYFLKTNITFYIVAVSFIGGGNRNAQIKPPTFHKSLTNLSFNVVHLSMSGIRTHNIYGDRHRLHK